LITDLTQRVRTARNPLRHAHPTITITRAPSPAFPEKVERGAFVRFSGNSRARSLRAPTTRSAGIAPPPGRVLVGVARRVLRRLEHGAAVLAFTIGLVDDRPAQSAPGAESITIVTRELVTVAEVERLAVFDDEAERDFVGRARIGLPFADLIIEPPRVTARGAGLVDGEADVEHLATNPRRWQGPSRYGPQWPCRLGELRLLRFRRRGMMVRVQSH
jgi:hypothetical protein